ncbi:hypothetical protein FACS1894147_11250 [Spirochaetia bacterium]|nr:hypothetical protein FACS1894147_11250 [Spirochaetia bacterium]
MKLLSLVKRVIKNCIPYYFVQKYREKQWSDFLKTQLGGGGLGKTKPFSLMKRILMWG